MQTGPISIATFPFEQLEKAWNTGDGAAFGSPFADRRAMTAFHDTLVIG